MKNFIGIICFLFLVNGLKAQIGVGEWRDHLPFNFAIDVTESPKKIYVASENGVFSYNKSSHSIEKFTKTNKLSDIGVSAIEYSDENELLLVGYSNGNVDLIFDNEVFNLSDIKREMINGSKSINHILFIDEYAYLSCGFGIVVLNTEKREIRDTYYIGDLGSNLQVNQMAFFDSYLYAATNQGIYVADYTNQNLIDYSNWQRINEIPNATSSFNAIYVADGEMLVNQNNDFSNDVLYKYEAGVWQNYSNEYNNIRKIVFNNESVHVVTNRNILFLNKNLSFQDSISNEHIPGLNPYDVIVNSNTVWIANRVNGLVKYSNGNYEAVAPNAPYITESFYVDVHKDKVIVASGGVGMSWENSYINGSLSTFKNESWQSTINYQASDYIVARINPQNSNHYYAGSWGYGVVEYENNEIVETYNQDNSPLQSVLPEPGYCRVAGLAFDNQNNLWIANAVSENPIVVKKNNNEWASFKFDNLINNIVVSEILITENNNKWVVLPGGNGLFVFNENETIDNENDDFKTKLSVTGQDGKVISNNIYAITEDLNGEIWLGTNQGIVVYYNPEQVFENDNFYASRVAITINDVTDYLLKTQVITSIAVDGANRKWIGTQSTGVYLVSEDGTKEINHFTEDNSPLLSNKINNIGINHESGEVFFATDKGLISYRGSATMGSDEFRDVYAYPNPVREDYTGEITIRGLVSDVNVKITDISGNIVYETIANGGQATWNGKNFSGRRVNTGVYLIFCTNDDGSKTYITKLLFIK